MKTVVFLLCVLMVSGEAPWDQSECVDEALKKSGHPTLGQISKSFAETRRKFIDNALSYNDVDFKQNCYKFFSSMNVSVELFFAEAKHCYAEEEVERSRAVQEAMPIFCTVSNETRKAIFDANIKIKCVEMQNFHNSCVDKTLNLCDPTVVKNVWKCLNVKIISNCSGEERDLITTFYKAVMKFSEQNSYCGQNHILIDDKMKFMF